MPPQQKSELPPPNILDDPELKKKFAAELAEIEAEREQIHEQLADCERLTEADFAVRINARD